MSMGQPAADPPGGKDAGKGIARKAERFEQERGEKLHIGFQGPVGFFLPEQGQRLALHRFGQGQPRRVHAAGRPEPLQGAFEGIGARIADPVDAVAKTH
ncbi:hypothetical protein D3C87_1959900 [compost metagenome]